MKKRMCLLLVLVLSLTIGALAQETSYEAFGGVFKDPSGTEFLIGTKVVFGSGQKTNALKLTAFETTDMSALAFPAKYILSYENNNLLFYPGFGFVLTDLDLFLQRDTVKKSFALGGSLDAFASLLTTAVQVKLMRLPEGHVTEGFHSANNSRFSPMDESTLLLTDVSEGFSAYLSALYKLYPDAAFRLSYLGNFHTNDVNSIWVNWVKPDMGAGSLELGLGIENGDRSFLPKGAYGVLGYSVSMSEYVAFEANLRLGTLRPGEESFVNPSLATYLKFIFDDNLNELVVAAGLETHKKHDLDEAPTFKFRLQYNHDRFPLSIYLTKADGSAYGIGLNYEF